MLKFATPTGAKMRTKRFYTFFGRTFYSQQFSLFIIVFGLHYLHIGYVARHYSTFNKYGFAIYFANTLSLRSICLNE